VTVHTSTVTTASVAMAGHGQAARVPGHPWPMAPDQGGQKRRRQRLDRLDPGPGRPDPAADHQLRRRPAPCDDGSPTCRSFKGERKGGGETQPCRRHPRLRPGIPGLAQAEAERRMRSPTALGSGAVGRCPSRSRSDAGARLRAALMPHNWFIDRLK
jgi:hypothetical protein